MTRLGFGASGPWAARWFSEDRALAVLRAGLASGIADVDTGPSYAGGHAEPRLGRLLARLAAEGHAAPRLSSKVGTRAGADGKPVKDFAEAAMARQLDGSLAALGTERLDVLYLHGPSPRQLEGALPWAARQKAAGRIGAVGVCVDGAHVRAAIRPGVDWIMAPYNALAQHNRAGLLEARAAGIRLATVAPLAQAAWRRDILLPRGRAGAWYAARALLRGRANLAAARRARWLREVPGWSPAALSLAFVRETLAPDLILTTTTNPEHLSETAEAMGRPVPDDLRARLHGLVTD